MSRLARGALAAVLLLGLALVAAPAARWLDRHGLDGRLKDAWGALRWQEDWATATPLPRGLDPGWMAASPAPWRIAHALGASGSPAQNTLPAMRAARRDGMSLFEVDLWLDAAGALRCHHGPAAPPPDAAADCTLDRLLPEVAADGGWVVLDIKTEFEPTAAAVVRLLQSDGLARHAVFQLYLPQHLALFAAWARALPLPAPIVTTYAAHRGVQHIADHLPALNVSAMAMPWPQRAELLRNPPGLALLLHPVHDCAAWDAARAWGARGVYTITTLNCPQRAAAG